MKGSKAIQFPLNFSNGFNMKGVKKSILAEKIFILGGIEGENQSPTDRVLEFNASDLSVKRADWRLPQKLSSFAIS